MEGEQETVPELSNDQVSITLSELEWLSKIFSYTKHRAVSLRQLSFL